jgi:hypothetical protein
MIHPLTAKREKFCQLVAAGATYTDAYLEAYQKPAGYDRKVAAEEGSRLMAITDVKLRVQELRRPVIRKMQQKLEYNLQKALAQADEMYQLAYEQGNVTGMGKAITLQSKLVKILSDQVEHHHGLLDDASTETLLAMKTEIENRKKARLQLAGNSTLVEVKSVS